MWQDADTIKTETGLVFGEDGDPYLDEALRRATANGTRRTLVIAAASASAVAGRSGLLVAPVRSRAELFSVISNIKKDGKIEAVLFYGLSEFSQQILDGIAGVDGTPQESHWGQMSRQVANAIRALMAASDVVWATCSVKTDPKEGDRKLNLNPAVRRALLDEFSHKVFVGQRRKADGTGQEVVIQEDPKAALEFRLPQAPRPPASNTRPTTR